LVLAHGVSASQLLDDLALLVAPELLAEPIDQPFTR